MKGVPKPSTRSPLHDRPGTAALHSDEPIRSRNDDSLSRTVLVDNVAAQLLHADLEESLVVGLNAPWGSGKSSFLHMLQESLQSSNAQRGHSKRPIVIWFNPWHHRNVEQLVRMFFHELGRGLRIGTRSWNAIKRGFARLLTTVGRILPGVGRLAGCPALVTSVASKEMIRYGDQLAREQPLGKLKTKLDRQLARLSRPIVVFIDDIDRLEADVTKSLFRMVRLNANFPNVVYVLAFDRQHVERCLEGDDRTFARRYLEKIVQVAVDIPAADPTTLVEVFDTALNDCIKSIDTRPLNAERYRTVLDASFAVHFRTIRTIKRYVNGLRFTLPPIAAEVDLADFTGIEMIRMFHPEIYAKMADERELLTVDALMPELLLEDDRDEMRAQRQQSWFDELTTALGVQERHALKKLLQVLFPGFAGGRMQGEGEENLETYWRRHGRVCVVDVFDKFFQLAVPSGRVSQAELDTFMAALANLDTAVGWLREARQAGNIRDLLKRTRDALMDIPEEQAATLAMAILVDTEWDRHDHGFTARPMVIACLQRQDSAGSRRSLRRRIATDGGTLLTVVEVLDRDDVDGEMVGPEEDETVRGVVMRRLEEEADEGSLWADDRWYYMLSTWDKWGGREGVRRSVMNWVTTEDGLIQFLEGERSAQASHAMGGRIRRLDSAALERWIDAGWVERRLEEMAAKGGPHAAKAAELLVLLNDDG